MHGKPRNAPRIGVSLCLDHPHTGRAQTTSLWLVYCFGAGDITTEPCTNSSIALLRHAQTDSESSYGGTYRVYSVVLLTELRNQNPHDST